jgi:hypothetical protein
MHAATFALAKLKINEELARAERERIVRSAGGRSGFFFSIGLPAWRARLWRLTHRRSSQRLVHIRPAGA